MASRFDDLIDPQTGITPEKSSKPQVPKSNNRFEGLQVNYTPGNIGQQRVVQGTDVNIGTDMFGTSNMERIENEFGPTNVLTQDVYNLRAAEQPWTHQAANFLWQAAGQVIGGSVQGIGYLAGLPAALSAGVNSEQEFGQAFVESLLNNPIAQGGENIMEWTRETAPIYAVNPGTFNPGDSGWWFSNGVSIASSLSLMIPAMGVSKGLSLLGKGAKLLAGASKSRRIKAGVEGTLNFLQGGSRISNQMIARGVTQATISRHMENMMEASGTYETTYQDAIAEGATEKQAREIAADAASKNYQLGWAMLGQDILQYGLMAKFKIPGTTATNKIEEALYKGMGNSKVAQFFNKNRGIGNGVTQFLSEGAEEAYQFIAAQEAQYSAMYNAGLIDETKLGERLGDYAQDGEMWTSAFFGGFGGLVSDAFGGRAQAKELEKFQTKQLEWLKARGGTFAQMANNVQKADESGNINDMITARLHLNVNMTTEAIDVGQFDYHVQQMEELAGMSNEQLAAYNAEHKGMELTPEFRDKVLPVLIAQSKSIGEKYEAALDKGYESSTATLIAAKEYTSEFFQERAKHNKTKLDAAVETEGKNIKNKQALNLALRQQALEGQLFSLAVLSQGEETDVPAIKVGRDVASAKQKSVEEELAQVQKELSELEISKEDKKAIDTLLNISDIQEANIGANSNELLANIELETAQYFKTSEYQQAALKNAYENAINIATEKELDKLSKNLKTEKLTNKDKESIQAKIDAQRTKVKEANLAAAADRAEETAIEEAQDQSEVVPATTQTTPSTTPETTEEGTDAYSALPPEFRESLGQTTPELPIPAGTQVRVKSKQFENRIGTVVDKTDAQGRVYVQFNVKKQPLPFSVNNVEVVPNQSAAPQPAQAPTSTTESEITDKKADIERRRQEELSSVTSEINIEENRRPNGSIGTQGFTPENLKSLIEFLNKELSLNIPSALLESDSLKPLIEHIKSNKELVSKIKNYVKKDPVEVYYLPDGTIQFQDGNHRANLLNLIGSEIIPAIEVGQREIIDIINAKYDAELNDLEAQPTQQTSEVEAKKADIAIRREDSLHIVTQEDLDRGEDVGIIEVENGLFEGTYYNSDNVAVEMYEGTLKEVQEKINAKYDAELAALNESLPQSVTQTSNTIEDKKANIERRRQEELLGKSFTATTEKVVTGKGQSAGKTVVRFTESKISSDGEVLIIKPKAKFKNEDTSLTTIPETITVKEFREQFYENLSEQDKEMFDEFFTDDSTRIKLVEARIGLKGNTKGQVNIDVESLEGQPFGFKLQKGKEINAKYDAELAALESTKPADKKADNIKTYVKTIFDEALKPGRAGYMNRVREKLTQVKEPTLVNGKKYVRVVTDSEANVEKIEIVTGTGNSYDYTFMSGFTGSGATKSTGKQFPTFIDENGKESGVMAPERLGDFFELLSDAELDALEQQPTQTEVQEETTEVPQETTLVNGKLKVMTPYVNNGVPTAPGYQAWLDSGAKVDGAPILFKPIKEEDLINMPGVNGQRLLDLFNKLKEGKEDLTPEERYYLMDNFPLTFVVLGKDGQVLRMDSKPVTASINRTYKQSNLDTMQSRLLRGTIIMELAKNGEFKTTLAQDVTMVPKIYVNSTKDTGQVQENNVKLFDDVKVGDNGREFVTTNKNNQYVYYEKAKDTEGTYDSDLSYTKDTKHSGEVYIKVRRPDGGIIPVKLNRTKLTNEEAEYLVELYTEIITNQLPLNSPYNNLERLAQILPEYETILKKYPTYAEVIGFFMYQDNDDVASRTNKNNYSPYPTDIFIMSNKGVINYNYHTVTLADGKTTKNQHSVFTYMTANNPAEREAFKQFLMSKIRHQVNMKALHHNEAYRNYMIDNGKLNTDVDTKQMWTTKQMPVTGNVTVNVKATMAKPKSTAKPKPAAPVVDEIINSEENKENANTGNGVSINSETAAVMGIKKNIAQTVAALNKIREDNQKCN